MSSKIKCLNNWDVESKHVFDVNGISDALYAGECRYGGGEKYVLYESKDAMGFDAYNLDSTEDKAKTLTAGRNDTHNIPVTCYGISAYNSNCPCQQDAEQGGATPHAHSYVATQFAGYKETLPTLRASGGDLGGGSEGLIVIKVETIGHDIRSTQFARGGAQTHYATQTTRNRR